MDTHHSQDPDEVRRERKKVMMPFEWFIGIHEHEFEYGLSKQSSSEIPVHHINSISQYVCTSCSSHVSSPSSLGGMHLKENGHQEQLREEAAP